MKAAFTLLEILVVFTIIAVLVAIAIPATTRMSQYSARVKTVSNMRQIGVAAYLYANDHNQQLPGQPAEATLLPPDTGNTWPQLFCQYLSPIDPRVFLDPNDRQTALIPVGTVLNASVNNTGYLYNGFDELAADGQPPATVPLNRIATPSQVILLAPKTQGTQVFYADVLLQPLATLTSEFNPTVYNGGAPYLFADGSVRFLKQTEYSNNFWLVDKTIQLPTLPDVPLSHGRSGIASSSSRPACDRERLLGDISWR